MSDLGWSSYIAGEECGHEAACLQNRVIYGLTGFGDDKNDPDGGIDCGDKICRKTCPFNP